MRILVVQESDWLEVGPHQSHHLMERMVARGHEVRVIDFEIRWRMNGKGIGFSRRQVFENHHKVLEEGGITVIRPGFLRMPLLDYATMTITHFMEIKRQIGEFKPDVVIGFGILNARIAIRSCKSNGIPFVYYLIDELHKLVPQKMLQSVARVVEKDNMRRADLVLSINKALREYTLEMGAKEDLTEVIPAGIDLESFEKADGKEIRSELGFSEDDIVLFFMGWLYNFSGLKEVAEEMAKRRDKRIKLLILGKGDLWEKLQRIRKENGLEDSIVMIGWKPYSEVPKYIKAADVCILPAQKNEIMKNIVPIKMYEYMAAGKPALVTKQPGLYKEFGDDNGVIYMNGPRETLERTLELIERGSIESNGKKARGLVEQNDWKAIADHFESCIQSISVNDMMVKPWRS